MKTVLRVALVGGVLIVLAIGLLALALSYGPYPDANIFIDGDAVSLDGIDGWAAAFVFTAAAMAMVGFALAVVLGVLASLAAAIVVALLGVGAAAVVLLVLASPILLVGWLVWRAVHGAKPSPPAAAAS
jgi:hypothetical protein